MGSSGRADSVAIEDAIVKNLRVCICDPPQALPLRLDKGINYHGILGYTFLSRFITTIDYRGKRLFLRPAEHRDGESRGGADRRQGGRHVINMIIRDGLIFGRGRIDGAGPLTFLIDTGSAEVLLTPNVAARLKLRSSPVANDSRAARFVRIDRISLGTAQASNIPAVIHQSSMHNIANLCHGIVGYPFLSNFTVTIDYQAATLTLASDHHADSPKLLPDH